MKVVSNTLVVAATIKSTVDAFQVPLGSKITGPTQGHQTLSSFRTTNTLSPSHPRRSFPFFSPIRSTSNENNESEVNDENGDSDSEVSGHNESIVDKLSLEEQKELILQQLSMVDGDEDDAEFDTEEKDSDENVRSVSFNVEDVGYYNYYDDDDVSQRADQSYDYDDNYYGYDGYDDVSEDLPPRERRRRRRQRESLSSFGEAASDLAETAIRIGGKATNVAKKTTEKAWQNLVENTFEDEWDEDEYQSRNHQRRRRSSSRPSRSTARPRSRYERDRRGPPSREQRTRQNVGDFTTYRSQVEENKEYDQTDSYRMRRRDPRRRRPSKPIEKNNDSFEPTDTSDRPPSRRQRTEISNEEDADSSHEEETENDDNDSPTDGKDPSWKSILDKTSKVASKKAKAIPRKIVNKAERTAQKAKEMSYKAVSNLLEEDDEEETKVDPVVMDAVIEDKTEERVVEAEAIPMGEWPSNTWSKSQQPSTRSSRSETMRDATFESTSPRPKPRKRQQASSSTARRRRRPRPRRPQRPGSAEDDRITSDRSKDGPIDQEQEQKYHYGLFQLPPAEGTFQQPTMDEESSTREESTERDPRRKVYSPHSRRRRRPPDDYDYYEDTEDSMYTDGIDRMGNFVAEALDTFLWGREDGEDRPYIHRRGPRNAEARANRTTDNKTSPKRHKRSGHWKDRMEEQFDEFLGIHEGGKYYDRWSNQESELEDLQESNRRKNGTGRDPVSFARGEVRRGNRRGRSRPIWEVEDSLLSVLFGTDNDTVRRNARMYRSSSNLPFLGNGGSLLRVVQSLLGSLALLAGRVSQWASVRGSVPQPVIVVGILSALLSARPGKRWQTVLFATLALRMLGELLHGYMYDDLDFEDDLSEVNHRDDRDSGLEDDDFDVGKYDGADYM